MIQLKTLLKALFSLATYKIYDGQDELIFEITPMELQSGYDYYLKQKVRYIDNNNIYLK